MLSDLIFKIKGENNNKEISDFLNILDCIYKNKEPEIDEFILKNLGIEKRENDLKIYGKNYPLFKMLYYFNEITLFNSEKESIIFLKNNNLNPSKTYFELDISEKEKVHLVEAIGECDFRIVEGSNERIQLSALLAKMGILE